MSHEPRTVDRRMTVTEYVEYVKTGKRDPHVTLPLVADARKAEEILIADGTLAKITPQSTEIGW